MTTTSNTPPDDLEARIFTAIGGPDTAAADPAAAPPPPLTSAQIIAGAISAGREVFCAVTQFQSPRRHLDDATAQHLGELWGPVLEKHNIDLGKYLGDWGVEIAAVLGTAGIVLTLRKAVMQEARERDQRQDTASQDEATTVNETHDGPTI
jgi:hypothetical protein